VNGQAPQVRLLVPEFAQPLPGTDPAMEALLAQIRGGAEDVDRGRRSLAEEIGRLKTAGLLAALVNAEGVDGRWAAAGAAPWLFDTLVALGGASLPLARLYEGHVDAIGLVWRHGGAATRRLVRDAVAGGGLLGVWGADAPTAPVRATDDLSGCLTLSGAKLFASGVGLVSLAVITATDADGGCRMLLVDASEASRQDAALWDMDGMVGSASGGFTLDAMRVSADYQIGKPGALFAEPWFHGGLWRICAAQAGAILALAAGLHQHLQSRGQIDDPLQRQRLAHVVLAAETAMLWSRAAAAALRVAAPRHNAIEVTLLAREAVEQAAVRAIEVCERAAGTSLHSRRSPMGRMVRDLRLYLRQASLDAKLESGLGLWLARNDRPI